MLKSKILLLTTLLGFSISSFGAYFPDLFGAGMRGAEQARQDNARDAYYYQQVNQARSYQQASQPTFIMDIYANGSSKPKMMKRLSIRKHDSICWMLYNVPANTTYNAIERFTLPRSSGFNGLSTHKTIGQRRVSENIVELYHEGNSGNTNQFENCWSLEEGMPLGTYSLTVTVGKNQFKTQSFHVVN